MIEYYSYPSWSEFGRGFDRFCVQVLDDCMRCLFYSDQSHSQLSFYVSMLAGMNSQDECTFEFGNSNFRSYDVILLMGTDDYLPVEEIRDVHPQCKIGIVDPRSIRPDMLDCDFAVAQGIEQENWLSNYFQDICRYEFHPVPTISEHSYSQSDPLILGYHGNKVHLHTMFPAASHAIESLAESVNLEVWAIYNVRELGPPELDLFPSGAVTLRTIQWSPNVYDEVFPSIDIGLVPSLIPISDLGEKRPLISSHPGLYNEASTDYIVRYKNTSNAARIFPFAAHGIPVIADPIPSACHAIEEGETGLFGGTSGMWYRSLNKLSKSTDLRERLGRNLQAWYLSSAAPEVSNLRLKAFLEYIVTRESARIPSSLRNSETDMEPARTAGNVDFLARRLFGRIGRYLTKLRR